MYEVLLDVFKKIRQRMNIRNLMRKINLHDEEFKHFSEKFSIQKIVVL